VTAAMLLMTLTSTSRAASAHFAAPCPAFAPASPVRVRTARTHISASAALSKRSAVFAAGSAGGLNAAKVRAWGAGGPLWRGWVRPGLLSKALRLPFGRHSGERVQLRMLTTPADKELESVPEVIEADVLAMEGSKLVTLKLREEGQGTTLQGVEAVFESGAVGTVVWQRTPLLFVLLDDATESKEALGGSAVVNPTANVTVAVGPDLVGRCLDARGKPCDGGASVNQEKKLPVFGAPVLQGDMATISKPLHTGITAVDALTPIGRGQNMLLVGPLTCGRRELAHDTVVHQAKEGVTCVYVCTQPDHKEILSILEKRGAMEHSIFISAGLDPTPAECVTAAATGCAVAEELARKGQDALVVVDDLQRHRDFWDVTERTLIDTFGVGSVAANASSLNAASSEMRIFYASLFQRVGYLNKKAGGGSISMLVLVDRHEAPPTEGEGAHQPYTMEDFDNPLYGQKVRARLQIMADKGIELTPAVLKKLDIPPPEIRCTDERFQIMNIEDLMSLSDGQIVLDEELLRTGKRPPIDGRASLTRIGIGHDSLAVSSSPAMRAVASRLRFELAQALDLVKDDMSVATVRQRNRYLGWQAAMHQDLGQTRRLSESVALLLAASKGMLDKVGAECEADMKQSTAVIAGLLFHIRSTCAQDMKAIDDTLDLSFESKRALEKELSSYFDK